jgi:hypothetical protein
VRLAFRQGANDYCSAPVSSPLVGQTSTNLVLTNLLGSQAGNYSVVISNTFDGVTSAPAQLVINDAWVDSRMYAGLNMSGLSGATYVLSFTTSQVFAS